MCESLGRILTGAPQRLDLGLDGVIVALQLIEMSESGRDFLRDAARCVGIDLLAQSTHACATWQQQTPGVGSLVAREQAQQGALARAVRAHEADPVARAHVERHAFEQRATGNLPGDVFGPQQHGGNLANGSSRLAGARPMEPLDHEAVTE
jgi:hypothetical protein